MNPLRRSHSLFALAALACPALAQVELEWSTLYPNQGTQDEDGRISAVASTPDGLLYAAAVSAPSGRPRFLRYGPTGLQLWSRFYAPTSCAYDTILVGSASQACFVGQRTTPGSLFTYELACLEPDGTLRWSRSFAPPADSSVRPSAVLDTNDNLLLVGSASSSATLTRFACVSATGVLTFDHTIDVVPNAVERTTALALAPDGSVFVAGTSAALGFVARLDTQGQVQWLRTSSGPAAIGANLSEILLALDGSVVAAGQAFSAAGSPLPLFEHFAADGTPLASVVAHGIAANFLEIRGLVRSTDGAFWSAGHAVQGSTHAFAARWIPGTPNAASFRWSTPSTNFDPAPVGVTLTAASAGQVWITTNVFVPPTQSQKHAALLLLGADLSNGVSARAFVGDDLELKEIGCAGLAPNGRLLVGGRSEAFSGPFVFFEPIPWLAQFDASETPQLTCSGQTDAAGCTPTFVVSGLPLAGAPAGFVVSCVNMSAQRSGLFFYGTQGPASSPLGGGTLCVASPVRRGPLLDSGPSPLACGGSLSLDWSAYAAGALGGAPLPGLSQPGTVVHLQGWVREPSSSFGSLLTGALRYIVLP
ncbi:MAG: hypothetical protein NTV21_05850 [Planctomycetota bacterium]|nr:hypothetical protein [Planctomycetota bacterium]